MGDNIPYGFVIEKSSGIFNNKYDVIDASRDKVVMKAEYYGNFKPQIFIMNLDESVVMTAKKTSFWGNSWKVERKGIEIAEVRDATASACNTDFEILTDSESIIASRMKHFTYQCVSSLGKEVFLFEKSWTLREKFLLEVSEDFDPLVALCVSFIFNGFIKQQQHAVTYSTT